MQRVLVIISAVLSLLVGTSVAAQSTGCRGIEVLAAQVAFPKVTVQFQLCDQQSRPIVDLNRGAIRLLEDGITVADYTLDSQIADVDQPVLNVPLVSGAQYPLTAIGASIGIVFDASQLLNGSGADVRDNIGAGRRAIEAFLLEMGDPPPPRTKSPANPERVALFIPVEQPSQSLFPSSLPGFTQDRYAVINTLRQDLPIRQGKTSLAAAIQTAIDATARDARQNGGNAIVLVVSDGGDALTGDTFNSLIAYANQQNVKVIAFGIGTDKALSNNGFRLKQLAESTGGIYFERPGEVEAGQAFLSLVQPQSTALYTLTYNSRIIDDGKDHSMTLEISIPGGTQNYTLPLRYNGTATTVLVPLHDVLVRQYLIFALPIAILVSFVLQLVIGGFAGSSPASATTKR
jgi:hypothetical protein